MKYFGIILTFVFLGLFSTVSASVDPSLVPCDGVFEKCEACHLVQIGQNIITWFIDVMATVIAFIFAWAGVKMVMSAGNSEGVTSAKHMMTNSLIGFVILLTSYLIVDTVMKAFIVDSPETQQLGPWNEIACVTQPDILAYKPSAGNAGTGSGFIPGSRGTGIQCQPSNPACSVSVLASRGFNQMQANIMSCIAVTESSGNPNQPPLDQTPRGRGKGSSACGLFSITRSTWGQGVRGCENFDSSCRNAVCNTRVAVVLVRQSGYSSWTCPGCNSKAQACVNRYSSGN